MTTPDTNFALGMPIFRIGDVLQLRLPVGFPGADGAPVLRPAVIAGVSESWRAELRARRRDGAWRSCAAHD